MNMKNRTELIERNICVNKLFIDDNKKKMKMPQTLKNKKRRNRIKDGKELDNVASESDGAVYGQSSCNDSSWKMSSKNVVISADNLMETTGSGDDKKFRKKKHKKKFEIVNNSEVDMKSGCSEMSVEYDSLYSQKMHMENKMLGSTDEKQESEWVKNQIESDSGETGKEEEKEQLDVDKDEAHRTVLRQELAEMSFEELEKLKERIGSKLYNEALFGSQKTNNKYKKYSRANKNRPREVSSKAAVPLFREVYQVKRKVYRDPRFDDLSGTYHEDIFKNAYSFLSDIKAREKKELQEMLNIEDDPEKRKQIQFLLKRMKNQEKTERLKEVAKEKIRQEKQEIVNQLKEGKKPHFKNKSEKKKLELAERFEKLKKENKLTKYLERKRKKNATKERRHLPL
ncbi:ribosomal RNA processing protein 36 homolog [Tachypleus tridentatus]|uniref:ribosomal RNA processing protein 36 homolog n=1 Tax=Tachypleus tridentatus TaxID=6853 RepID=UPI003FD464EB